MPLNKLLVAMQVQLSFRTEFPLMLFGRPFVKRFALCYRTIVLSICLWRWCIVAKRSPISAVAELLCCFLHVFNDMHLRTRSWCSSAPSLEEADAMSLYGSVDCMSLNNRRQSIGPKPDSRPRLEGARYKYLTSCSCLLSTHPSSPFSHAHIRTHH